MPKRVMIRFSHCLLTTRLTARLAVLLGVMLTLTLAPAARAGIATVTQDIPTSYATYHPIPVTVTPQARQYTIAPDLSNVSNIGRFNFTAAQKALLAKNGFVAVKSDHITDMTGVYADSTFRQIPAFITVDLMLHVLHKEYDAILKGLEKKKFLAQVTNVTTQSLAAALSDYAAATSATARSALKCNAAYFAVAASLLGTAQPSLPSEIKSLADAELALVNAQAGEAPSPLFTGEQDYSQFIVRGHYVGDPDLERYFRAMMWYGTMRFSFKRGPATLMISDADLRRMALQALLLARGVRASADWNAVYQATSFLAGRSEGATLLDIDRIATGIYGAGYAALSPDALADPVLFDRFFASAQVLPPAQINPQWGVYGTFMGQRTIPDSYIMSQTMAPGRMPRGLDVMAVLGSARAEEILKNLLRSPAPNLDTLRTTFNGYPAANWVQNVYWNWLYCLVPVLEPKGAGYPPYMQNLAWQDKDLAAALGSWAELRHDVILYGQSASICPSGDLPLPDGAVEANPAAFARLAALFQYLCDGLANLNLISAGDADLKNAITDTLDKTRQIALTLKALAEKELANTPLTHDEDLYIEQLGKKLGELLDIQAYYLSLDIDRDMGLIADVATDGTFCQEEAVGRPLDLFVIIDTAGDLHIARGAAFSYYEFAQPIAQRLTDQQWRTMLNSQTPPSLPAWLDSYFDHSTQSVYDSLWDPVALADYYYMDLSFSPDPVGGDQKMFIKATIHGEFIPPTVVAQFTPPGEQTTVTLTLTQSPYHPYLFTGTVSTQDWHEGTCNVTCKGLTSSGVTYLTERTTIQILPYPVKNAIRPDLWRRFD